MPSANLPVEVGPVEHNLIVDWLALGFTAAKIRQRRQSLDADGVPRFTIGETDAIIRQVRTRPAAPVAAGPVAADFVSVDQAPTHQLTLTSRLARSPPATPPWPTPSAHPRTRLIDALWLERARREQNAPSP
jgi:hypothetical protein